MVLYMTSEGHRIKIYGERRGKVRRKKVSFEGSKEKREPSPSEGS